MQKSDYGIFGILLALPTQGIKIIGGICGHPHTADENIAENMVKGIPIHGSDGNEFAGNIF